MIRLLLNKSDDSSLTLPLVFKDGKDDKDEDEGMNASPSCSVIINADRRKKAVGLFIGLIWNDLILHVDIIAFRFDCFWIDKLSDSLPRCQYDALCSML